MATYKPLSTDFKDDILASQNSKRKYTQVNNSDGTVSFQDSTAYSQVGSSYGAKEVNEEREAINNIYANKLVSLDEIDLVTEEGYFVDAKAVKELNSKIIKAFNIHCPKLNAKANSLTKISLMSKVDFESALKNAGCTQALGFCALRATYEDQIQCTFSLHQSAGLYVQLDSRWSADLTVEPVCCVIAK